MTTRHLTQSFFSTNSSQTSLFIQRALLGAVIFPHGAQKLLGWFGGYGFEGTMGFFTGQMHLPAPVALLVILGEFFGSLLLVAGFGTRLAAFGISAIMLGAVATTHLQVGFFMNWFGAQQGEGFEYHLLALALSVPLMIWGGGKYALDSTVQRILAAPRASSKPSLA
jgi:putative oxidoreductase